MKKKLLAQIQDLDHQLNQLVVDLKSYSHEDLNALPKEGGWSVIQIMHHVFLSEKYSLQYCQKKLSFSPTLKEAGVVSKLKSWLVQVYLNSPLKLKAPKAIGSSVLPKEGSLEEVLDLWQNERTLLQQFIDELADEYVSKEIYKHPFGGRLSLEGMFDFFGAHFNNHVRQIWRALKH